MNVLVLSPHADDAELGCGATVAKLLDAGHKVTFAIFTDRDANTPLLCRGQDHDIERAACALAGKYRSHLDVIRYTLPLYTFGAVRQDVLSLLEFLRRDTQPQLVFAPAANDINQDHVTIHLEAARVFRGVTLYGYEIIRSQYAMPCVVFSEVSEDHLKRKVRAVRSYRSQRDKAYCQPGVIHGLAMVRGAMGCVPLAETFAPLWEILPL